MVLKQKHIGLSTYSEFIKTGYKVFLKWDDGRLSGISHESWNNDYKLEHFIEAEGHRIWFFDSESQAKEYIRFLEIILEDYYSDQKATLCIKPIKYRKLDIKLEGYFCAQGTKHYLQGSVLDGIKNRDCFSVSAIIIK